MLSRLMARLRPQLTDRVQVLLLTDNGEKSIGVKRNVMVNAATAEWVSFVDDDDLVPADYCRRILSHIDAGGADVLGFRLGYFVDGVRSGEAIHSYTAAARPIRTGGIRFDRLPNHLNPTRRTLAVKAGYRDLTTGEDGDYARSLAKLKPREEFIDAELYQYLYVPGKRYEHWKGK